MARKARKGDEEDRPRRYRTALEEIRHELREFWSGPPYDKGDKLPATLAREECRQLMTAYTSGKWAFRNNLISRILYGTGMRGEELENVKVCDLFYDQGTIFVRAGKGDKDRYVCCDEETLVIFAQTRKKYNRACQCYNIAIPEAFSGVKKTKNKKTPKTYASHLNSIQHLSPVFDNEFIEDINIEKVDKYRVKRLDENRKPGTVNRELACLKYMLNKAEECGFIRVSKKRRF